MERLQTANGWTPVLPVSERRGAQSEAVPRGFHVGKYSSYDTHVTVFWNAFNISTNSFCTAQTFILALAISFCAAGNLDRAAALSRRVFESSAGVTFELYSRSARSIASSTPRGKRHASGLELSSACGTMHFLSDLCKFRNPFALATGSGLSMGAPKMSA